MEEIKVEYTTLKEGRRDLQGNKKHESGSLVWFADMQDRYYERMKLLDAMQIQILPDDPDFGTIVEFGWDILGYD